MEKGTYVKDIIDRGHVAGIFLVIESSSLQTTAGKPFWKLKLQDNSGRVDALIWHPTCLQFEDIPRYAFVQVGGRGGSWNGQPQITVETMSFLEENQVNQDWLMMGSPYDLDTMLNELVCLCKREFVYPPWRKLVNKFLSDSEYRESFRIWPAAKQMHHAYRGGLLEHTLQVFKSCRQLADIYPSLDRQTLLAGALFHDFGKLREFSGGLDNDYTDEGNLFGHMMLGVQMLTPMLSSSGLDDGLQQHLLHLILSHHGQLEFNAVTLPQTAEALALHHADDLDAKMARCREILGDIQDDEKGWSAKKDFMFGRYMFHPIRTPMGNAKNRVNSQREECLLLWKE